MKWIDAILFVREERYSLIDRNTNSTMKICFFFLFNFLQLHEIIYFLPCIFENTVFSQKFVGKIGAPIFNRLIPPSLALAGSHLFKFEEAERWLWSSSLGSLTTPYLPASPFLLHYRTWNALATYRRSSFIILGPETRRLPCYSRRTDGIKGWRVFIDLWLGRSVDNYWTIGFPRWNSVYTMDGSVHPSSAAARGKQIGNVGEFVEPSWRLSSPTRIQSRPKFPRRSRSRMGRKVILVSEVKNRYFNSTWILESYY